MNDDAIFAVLANENIRKLLEKVSANPELQARFAKIRDTDEAYKLAVSVQDGYTKEEFVTEVKKLYTEATKDLSEEDIARLAGGGDLLLPVTTAMVGTLGCGALALGIIAL